MATKKFKDMTTTKKIIVCACSAFAVLLIIALSINLISLSVATSRKNKLAAELSRLDKQIAANSQSIEYFESDDYVNDFAREYLDMQGKGEISFTGR